MKRNAAFDDLRVYASRMYGGNKIITTMYYLFRYCIKIRTHPNSQTTAVGRYLDSQGSGRMEKSLPFGIICYTIHKCCLFDNKTDCDEFISGIKIATCEIIPR